MAPTPARSISLHEQLREQWHLADVKERRSDAEAADILDEAIELLRSRRKSGEIVF